MYSNMLMERTPANQFRVNSLNCEFINNTLSVCISINSMVNEVYLSYVQRFSVYFPENTVLLHYKDQSEITASKIKFMFIVRIIRNT